MFRFCSILVMLSLSAAVRDADTDAGGHDWDGIMRRAREVDWSAEADAYVVWQTDGNSIEEVSAVTDGSSSVRRFRNDLLKCGPQGKFCVGLYKFAYPMTPGSKTKKGKSVIMKVKDGEAMTEALGSSIKVMRVNMPTTMLWQQFTAKLKDNSISVSATMEVDGHDEIQDLAGPIFWDEIKRGTSRVGDQEEEAFLQHVVDQNEASVGGVAVNELPEAHFEEPLVEDKVDPQDKGSGNPGIRLDMAQLQQFIKDEIASAKEEILAKVDSIVDKKVQKVAQAEVGRAIKVLGTKTGDAMREMGQTWATMGQN